MLRNIIGPLFNFKNCVFFVAFFWLVFKKSSYFCRENEIFENKKTKKTKKLDHFLTLKRPKIGPLFNFTASRYSSQVSGSEVDLTLLMYGLCETSG